MRQFELRGLARLRRDTPSLVGHRLAESTPACPSMSIGPAILAGMRLLAITLLTSLTAVAGFEAQSWKPPADCERCPSKWGATDERGSANHMKPEMVLRAARLIRTGE